MNVGDIIEFQERIVLAGARAVVKRISKRTGTLTVELLDDRHAYKKGDTVHVAQHEVKRVPNG
jgi:hypothetical protein